MPGYEAASGPPDFRHTAHVPRPDHATVERTFRSLLADNGLLEPDEVAFRRHCIVFGWSQTKTIVVDLDEVENLVVPDVPR